VSYDLLVFDQVDVPRDRAGFMAWFEKQVDWPDDDSPFDPATLSPNLQSWYKAMLQDWPNMQEVDDDHVDDPHVTGYSLCPHAIYVDFRWSVAEEAYDATRRLAVERGVGFYDVSGDNGDGEIYFPEDTLRPPSTGQWRQVAADFRSGDVSKYIPENFPIEEPPKRRWFNIFRRDK
jgi:hypothetical protein